MLLRVEDGLAECDRVRVRVTKRPASGAGFWIPKVESAWDVECIFVFADASTICDKSVHRWTLLGGEADEYLTAECVRGWTVVCLARKAHEWGFMDVDWFVNEQDGARGVPGAHLEVQGEPSVTPYPLVCNREGEPALDRCEPIKKRGPHPEGPEKKGGPRNG